MGPHRQLVDHAAGVARLRESLAAIPAGDPVRLAKATTNLFRPRGRAPRGLDVSGLTRVLDVDPVARVAEVQGMCTYEHLVEATAAHGLMPLVVPQLRTITLGGAVSGLGIEATSYRNGLPHESVLELDVLTGSGDVVTARPDGEHADLFAAFPNSYGSLGYATRLRIELQPLGRQVALRHLHLSDLGELVRLVARVSEERSYERQPVDAMDGVVFGPGEAVLTLATFDSDTVSPASDYTGQDVYYRSLQRYDRDRLSGVDYLWRWDTDWFWCSGAFGAQHPLVRRAWPRRWRRSDVYHRIVRLENRFGVAAAIDRRRGLPERERVVQDVEVPLERLEEFVGWFLEHVPMRPIWLCPLRLREVDGPGGARAARSWPLYPLEPGRTYVNVGFWGTVPIEPGRRDGDVNRMIEDQVSALDGHKSLYSDACYDRATFDRLYGGPAWRTVRDRYDPSGRFPTMYDKVCGR
ncbi:FAD-binding oxidoreductase [Arsenicicoccus cauae]|uniref:FAD-binding oxidoreductase n=1 Tax=Arsenicicoccus cauae TaxID=2663847 RepID=UPI00370DD958